MGQKTSAATFGLTAGNAARNAFQGKPFFKTLLENLGVAAGTTATFSPIAAGAAQAAGGTLNHHLLAQGVNAGSSVAEALAGSLLGHYGANTEFVKRLVARQAAKAAKAAKAAPNTVRKVSRNVGLTSV